MLNQSNYVCRVEGCNQKHFVKGYCNRHYHQQHRHGKVLRRTRYDPNKFIIEKDICRIKLFDQNGNESAETIIDVEDYDKVKNIKWNLDFYGYVVCQRKYGNLRMHRVVLGLSKGDENPEHIDCNSLNNRKPNLRICTHQQNCFNSRRQKRNTSGYKGVYWNKLNNKWQASIGFNYKTIHIGLFKNKIDAAKAYNGAAVKYHGEFALLNNV